MKENILVLVPSKQNPDGVRRLATSFKKTSTRGSDMVMFVDSASVETYPILPYIVGYDGNYGAAVYMLLRRYLRDHKYFMLGSDSMEFKTVGWDYELTKVADMTAPSICTGAGGVAPMISQRMFEAVDFKAMRELQGVYSVWRFFTALKPCFYCIPDLGWGEHNTGRVYEDECVTAEEKEWLEAEGDRLIKEVQAYATSLRRKRDTALPR